MRWSTRAVIKFVGKAFLFFLFCFGVFSYILIILSFSFCRSS